MNPDQVITLRLSVQAVNIILQALGNMPFNQVASMVVDIRNQGEQQVAEAKIKEEAARAAAEAPTVKEQVND